MLPILVQQLMLVTLFIQTDPTVLPIGLVLSLISNLASLAFLAGAHCVLLAIGSPRLAGGLRHRPSAVQEIAVAQ